MICLSNDEIMARIGYFNNAGAEPVPLRDATWEDGQDKASGINKCPMPKVDRCTANKVSQMDNPS